MGETSEFVLLNVAQDPLHSLDLMEGLRCGECHARPTYFGVVVADTVDPVFTGRLARLDLQAAWRIDVGEALWRRQVLGNVKVSHVEAVVRRHAVDDDVVGHHPDDRAHDCNRELRVTRLCLPESTMPSGTRCDALGMTALIVPTD